METEQNLESTWVIKPFCPICATDLVYDADGTLSENGFECWYCPDCYWWTDDWVKYPRPKTATA